MRDSKTQGTMAHGTVLAAIIVLVPAAVHGEEGEVWCPDGQRAFQQGQYEEANQALSDCLYSPPEFPATAADAYFMRGETYLARDDLAAALGDYDRAIERVPEHADALRGKAWVHYKREEYHPAIKAIEASVKADSRSTKSHHIHALILIALDRGEAAMDAFDLAYSFEDRDTIKRLQARLADLGYEVGAMDGVYGARSRDALKACIEDACSFML